MNAAYVMGDESAPPLPRGRRFILVGLWLGGIAGG
jgi:hypothetical protein